MSLLAARLLAPTVLARGQGRAADPGELLIVGAGVQGRAHLEALASGLGVRRVRVASRSRASADALVAHARTLGLHAQLTDDADAALADCPLVVSCTSAQAVALRGHPRDDAWVCAVGAFTPRMVEWSAEVVRGLAARGRMVVDTRDADHEAGDLLQAGVSVPDCPALVDVVRQRPAWQAQAARGGPVFFKSCGWAGWDLAAARCVLAADLAGR